MIKPRDRRRRKKEREEEEEFQCGSVLEEGKWEEGDYLLRNFRVEK